ncbi:glycosyltransferase family 4 protein [Candidatus Pelagibacter sp.]|nr:glycosyltransferase family 4 protein [Candidatus Pelagibacter sp.]
MSSKLKVLQVIPKLGYGGAEIGCYDLAHYLKEQKSSSFIATSGGELLKYVDKKKVKLFRLPVHSKNPILMLINIFILSFIVLFNKINILHVRSRAPAWSCYYVSKITRCKLVTTFHGTYNFNNSIKKKYNAIMLKSDCVIAGSNFIFSHIKEKYPEYISRIKKFLVIFRGINTEYYDPDNIKESDRIKFLTKLNIDGNKKIILMPGRLTEWKGQEIFIEALNELKTKYGYKNFIAILLGSDQGRKIYKKKLIRLIERFRLNNEVIFLEHAPSMPVAYSVSNVIVSASIEPEAFGRISVEAQSMKKPIVASDIGGSRETIVNNKTGLLFSSSNHHSLSEKLDFIFRLDDTSLNVMGNNGRKNVQKKFNVEKMCFSTYSEYKKLINA